MHIRENLFGLDVVGQKWTILVIKVNFFAKFRLNHPDAIMIFSLEYQIKRTTFFDTYLD